MNAKTIDQASPDFDSKAAVQTVDFRRTVAESIADPEGLRDAAGERIEGQRAPTRVRDALRAERIAWASRKIGAISTPDHQMERGIV